MDLEHPDISKALKTGYPTNKDLARDNEPQENKCYDNHNTCEGDE